MGLRFRSSENWPEWLRPRWRSYSGFWDGKNFYEFCHFVETRPGQPYICLIHPGQTEQ